MNHTIECAFLFTSSLWTPGFEMASNGTVWSLHTTGVLFIFLPAFKRHEMCNKKAMQKSENEKKDKKKEIQLGSSFENSFSLSSCVLWFRVHEK